jgi:hypothetical protein
LVIHICLFYKGYSTFDFQLYNSLTIVKNAFYTIEYVPSAVEIEKATRYCIEKNIHSGALMHDYHSIISDFINARVKNYIIGNESLQQIEYKSTKFA